MGCSIEEIKLDYIHDAEEYWKSFYVVMMAHSNAAVERYRSYIGIEPTQDHFEKFNWLNMQRWKQSSATDYVKALNILHSTGRNIAKIFQTK